MKICVIGCGNVARVLKEKLEEELVFYDRHPEKCKELCENCFFEDPIEMFESGCDLIVEAASPKAVEELGLEAVKRADLLVLSVGALINEELREKLIKVAEESGHKVYVPSGAIAGIDAIKALREVGIDEVRITVRKNPKSLGVETSEEKVLFEGSAEEAVKKFPFNVNVVATLKLASGAPVKVRVVADPKVDRNIHQIEVISKASNVFIRVENVPSPYNPKTSYLAILSVLRTIKEIAKGGVLRVGT
ncbi:aspartate dehydrogenase [Ignicoccus pacificus DSM 13166]|uniref:L-aspartate dehydrogenase n=1 Tax=Ignicoccus pacificus DSM 13166 TaxID=940294 RepID=A0A977K961_9CREN|nr:aspartate dehydrogenase [Ignicoccus pacificus DSM 13166]